MTENLELPGLDMLPSPTSVSFLWLYSQLLLVGMVTAACLQTIEVAQTLNHFYFRCFLPPFSTQNLDMVEFAAVADMLKGMNRHYLETHSHHKMLHKRTEPWRKHHLHKLCDLRRQVGTKVGKCTNDISVALLGIMLCHHQNDG